ncbi:MAG: Gldg family protein [Akkermansiaceae bacterium]|nr:Gldg family protein [Akkermansiaceae bacterium]
MSDSPSTTPATRPVRRVGRSINVITQLVLFIIVIVAANYLSCAKHERYDLTDRQDFTLSDLSTKYLESDAVQKREVPLHVIAVIKRSSAHYTRIYNLLDEYKRLGGEAVNLEFVDPLRQTDRTLELENTFGQKYTEDMIIVDGRDEPQGDPKAGKSEDSKSPPAAATPTTPDAKADNPATSEKQELSAHVRTVRVSDLFLQDDRRNIVAWRDEDMITSTFIGAIEGKPRRIYFAADKINLEATDGDPAWQVLFEMLWQQNILLTPLRLSETESIPEDAEGFALVAPQYDLNDREIKTLSNYWDRKQSSIFITLDPKVATNNLRIFLRSNGVTPRNDRIMSIKNGQSLSNVQSVFSRGSEINTDLGGKSTIFDGSTCSLEVDENNDQLLNKRIQPIALVEASDGWWGETRFEENNPQFNQEEDTAAPLYLAAAVLKGQATSDDTADLVSRMVVIGNTDFLANKKTRPEQSDFVKSCVNWLVGREDLIGIGPKKLHRHKITILDAHNTFISRIVLIFLPAAALLMSLIVWNIRRA